MVRSYHVALVAIALARASSAAPAAPASHVYAVAKFVDVREECSDMGGRHVTFELDETAHRPIHAGGHGDYAKPTGVYYVLDVSLKPVDVEGAGWCLDHMPKYAGEATRYMVAKDLGDARAKLADVRAHGWPAHWDAGATQTYP
ncbi:MAG TPA: hypothetical protein VGG74_37505 [Kofleriaceae bacterium]|jgi:hypothetical protein